MRMEETRRNSKSSWPKAVKRWLTLKDRTEELRADETSSGAAEALQERRKSCSDKDAVFLKRQGTGRSAWAAGGAAGGLKPPSFSADENLSMYVGTWNVGGRAPHGGLNLREWLCTPTPADIYVLGFQEIVPLNAGNVLGTEDKAPAAKWLFLVRQALNGSRRSAAAAASRSCSFIRHERQPPPLKPPRGLSFSALLSLEDMLADSGEVSGGRRRNHLDDDDPCTSPGCSEQGSPNLLPAGSARRSGAAYCLVASKQMVGIFLCVWARCDLARHVASVRISCVGRGIMGYMGNKGSISISMALRQTTFCFVCTHLTSGEKDGDEVRRNADVAEILRRTKFPQPRRSSGRSPSPATILEHDKIVWLGDLNYRLAAASGRDMQELLRKNDWQALLDKDQLKTEQRAGRVFTGWAEGRIHFPPTYKYLANSDRYAVQTAKSREKPRTPAWCDRILWRGKGMKQVCYVRGESRFSDHRPVHAVFSVRAAEGSAVPEGAAAAARSDDGCSSSTGKCGSRWPIMGGGAAAAAGANGGANSASSCARVQAEELFLLPRARSCLETPSRFL